MRGYSDLFLSLTLTSTDVVNLRYCEMSCSLVEMARDSQKSLPGRLESSCVSWLSEGCATFSLSIVSVSRALLHSCALVAQAFTANLRAEMQLPGRLQGSHHRPRVRYSNHREGRGPDGLEHGGGQGWLGEGMHQCSTIPAGLLYLTYESSDFDSKPRGTNETLRHGLLQNAK